MGDETMEEDEMTCKRSESVSLRDWYEVDACVLLGGIGWHGF